MEMNNTLSQLALLLRDSDILMKEIEHEYNTAIDNIRFDGEEDFLHQYYKKILTSVYRMRNNAAALLLRYNCTCNLTEDEITIIIDDKKCTLSANAIKTILQDDYQKIIDKNKTDCPESIITITKPDSASVPVVVTDINEEDIPEVTETIKNIDVIAPDTNTNKNEGSQVSAEPTTIKETQEVKHNGTDADKSVVNTSKYNKSEVQKEEDPFFDPFEDARFFDEEPPEPEKNIHEEQPVQDISELSEVPGTADDILFDFGDDLDDLDIPLAKEPVKTETEDTNEDRKDTEIDDSFLFFDEDQDDLLEKTESGKIIDTPTSIKHPTPVFQQKAEPEPETEADDLFDFLDAGIDISDKTEKDQSFTEKPVEKADVKFNDGIFSQTKDDMESQKREEPQRPDSGSKFNLSQQEFIRHDEPETTIEEEPAHKFTAESISGDTEDLLDQLKKGRAAYDKEELERKLNDAQSVELKGNVINLSTGAVKNGDIDVETAIRKVSNVAQNIISASKKDMIMDAKLEENAKSEQHAYELQRDSDFVRQKTNFILDDCKVAVVVYEDGKIKSKDIVKLVIAPISIPETGTALVTDICAYMECNGEVHGAAVAPGKNSTLIIRGEDYTFLIRGSWENGDFKTAISIVGNGAEIKFKIDKKEIRPASMDKVGIGHNVIYADHATIAHIIPVTTLNDFGEYSNYMAVIVKDYGIDQDVDCKVLRDTPEMIIKGEKYKYAVNTSWDNDILKINFKTISR